jgi:hypothetical protein
LTVVSSLLASGQNKLYGQAVEPAAGRQEGEAAAQLELRAQRDLTILEVTRTARHLAEIDLQLEEANRSAHCCFILSDLFQALRQCCEQCCGSGINI